MIARSLAGSMLIHGLVVGALAWAAFEWPEPGQPTSSGMVMVELTGNAADAIEENTDAPPTAVAAPAAQRNARDAAELPPAETAEPHPMPTADDGEGPAAPSAAADEVTGEPSDATASESVVSVTFGSAASSASGASAHAGEEDEWSAFYAAVRIAVERAKRYPPSARRMGQEDRVTVSFLVLPGGKTDELQVVGPSQFPILNRAAVETVQRVVKFPDPPASANRTARVIVPLIFALNENEEEN